MTKPIQRQIQKHGASKVSMISCTSCLLDCFMSMFGNGKRYLRKKDGERNSSNENCEGGEIDS